MIADLTIRTRLGAVDLVPFLRRDEGNEGVELHQWERRPAVLALDARGWHPERIAHATGLLVDVVHEVLAGWTPPPPKPAPTPSAVSQASLRQRRRAERILIDGRLVHPDAPHGRPVGYRHWGCQCELCSTARALHSADLRRKTAERKAA
jgi:hypothetical protein